MKKAVAMVLVVVMMLALGVTAFAAKGLHEGPQRLRQRP